MTTPRVLIIETFAAAYAQQLAVHFPGVKTFTAASVSAIDVALDEIDILIAFGIAIDNPTLATASRLQWIQSLATGVDHFLRCKALKPNTILTSARGIHGPPMRETVAYLMLSVARRARLLHEHQTAHRWDRGAPWSLLHGKTAVIVGVGISGIAIAQLFKSFGMTVVGASRTPRGIEGFDRIVPTGDLAAAVSSADYVINVLPGAAENSNLIDACVFAAMQPAAIFINVGRGETVDEGALIAALQNRMMAGAGRDVFGSEPLARDNPLWAMPNVIVTPHIAGYVAEYEQLVMPIVTRNMRAFLADRRDEMRNIVLHP